MFNKNIVFYHLSCLPYIVDLLFALVAFYRAIVTMNTELGSIELLLLCVNAGFSSCKTVTTFLSTD